MAYSIEQIAMSLKEAREAKGLSQRALSKLVDVPQSHISKIENGGVDLRITSLVEIARALDLEVTLVPRKNLSAVRSITRQSSSGVGNMETTARADREMKRLQQTIARVAQQHSEMTEVAQLHRRINDLNLFKIPNSALDSIKDINRTLSAFAETSENFQALQSSLRQVQSLRNRLAHNLGEPPAFEKIRPAYSLDEDDHG